jgi:hypothetical protein
MYLSLLLVIQKHEKGRVENIEVIDKIRLVNGDEEKVKRILEDIRKGWESYLRRNFGGHLDVSEGNISK